MGQGFRPNANPVRHLPAFVIRPAMAAHTHAQHLRNMLHRFFVGVLNADVDAVVLLPCLSVRDCPPRLDRTLSINEPRQPRPFGWRWLMGWQRLQFCRIRTFPGAVGMLVHQQGLEAGEGFPAVAARDCHPLARRLPATCFSTGTGTPTDMPLQADGRDLEQFAACLTRNGNQAVISSLLVRDIVPQSRCLGV